MSVFIEDQIESDGTEFFLANKYFDNEDLTILASLIKESIKNGTEKINERIRNGEFNAQPRNAEYGMREDSSLRQHNESGLYGRTMGELPSGSEGTAEELKQTKVTQPAVFLHSVISALCLGDEFKPAMVAGHSLGELSALTAAGCLSFEEGLKIVAARALAMQAACEAVPGTMAAVIGLPDEQVEAICKEVSTPEALVIPANYNCPGQLVISGEKSAIEAACAKLKEAGAKRALVLPVSGAFHSPLMQPAKEELEAAIEKATFNKPVCPVYQNVDAMPQTDAEVIKQNLIAQLTSPVRWTQIVRNMLTDGVTEFTELGPGNVLQGLVKKVSADAVCESKATI